MTEDPEPLVRQIPDTPAGRQLAWWVSEQARDGEGVSAADLDRYGPDFLRRAAWDRGAEQLAETFRNNRARIGTITKLDVESASGHDIVVLALTSKNHKLKISLTVEASAPHRIEQLRFERQHDFKLEVREAAGPDDALIVADIERRCPIVMGDTSVWFDRGERYFDFSRLLEDCTVGLASVDGAPAAVSCGAERVVRVGGELKRLYVVSHLRVLPEHQRKGLWGAANSALSKYWDLDGSQAYISVDNLGMQHGFQGTPDKWPVMVQRVELDCVALAGPAAGRPATAADAAEIAARLNLFHGAEELYVPYDAAGFARRVERAPDLYAWDKVWLTEGALVGVWPAGQALRTVTETAGVQAVTMPAVVMDYAFAPGAEGEFEALLRAWCSALAAKGIDTLIIYTSPTSPGSALITGLARSTGAFFTWTPGIHPPADAAERGLYTDAAYF